MDDLISRQAAIKAIDEIESEVVDGDGFQYEKWRKYFSDLPSAQQWIPCDACKYNPPSAKDGKPCTMCPAEGMKAVRNEIL